MKRNSIHICFSTIDYHSITSGGGIASYIDSISKELLNIGNRVTIIGPGKKYSRKHVGNELQIKAPLGNLHWYLYKTGFPSWIYLPIREWEWSKSLYNIILKENFRNKIDIIESQEIGFLNLLRLKNKFNISVIVRLHGSPFFIKKYSNKRISIGEKIIHYLELWALKKTDGITSPSRFQKKEYLKLISKDIKVIPNPINGYFILDAKKNRENIHISPLSILYTGRIEYRKGVYTLLKALKIVKNIHPNIQLIIAGGFHNSIDKRHWEQTLLDYNLNENVFHLGHVPHKNLSELYRKSSIFVMPSYYETFCISVAEAMNYSMPVIVSNIEALCELVDYGKNGIIFKIGDEVELSKCIINLLGDINKSISLGKRARIKVQKNFDPKYIAEITSSYYVSIIN